MHKTNLLLFRIWNKADKAIDAHLTAATEKCFIGTVKDKYLGYGNVNSREITTHLFAMYDIISDSEIDLNGENMTSPWMPPGSTND